jgi:anti-sigma regulatory factor (Ser/Thr protein kinase)
VRSRFRLTSNPTRAPAAARRYVAEAMADAPTDVVEAIALMVSELATNCVVHAESDFTVSLDRDDTTVRVDVADVGAGIVALRDTAPDEPGGRGLHIVARLADEWGVREYVDRHGKSVWFTLRVPAAPAERAHSSQ